MTNLGELKKPKGNAKIQIKVEGVVRLSILDSVESPPVRVASVRLWDEPRDQGNEVAVRAMTESVREKMTELLQANQQGAQGPAKKKQQLQLPSDPSALVDAVASMLQQLSVEERQGVLEAPDVQARLELIVDLLQRERDAQRVASQMTATAQKSREEEMKHIMLQRQIRDVQKELSKIRSKMESADGEEYAEDGDEVAMLAARLEKAKLPEEAARIAKKELKRLKGIQPEHPEYTIAQTYLDMIAGLPWNSVTADNFDLGAARQVLEEDHRGLEKVKRRILEFLAVQRMRGGVKGPILCLHGPPGIGKTSLGKSVARALGRKFHRLALGGVRDEAELRGHRRTYIGSIPGAIIGAMNSVGVSNPVILLDEVDKVTQNAQFNPQATLLEILDPEQNDSFKDHYLNMPFDLSKVLFICTANDTSTISRPLLDRMELIELNGYTVEEKLAITETHLLPKQRRLHALESLAAPADEEPKTQRPEEPRLLITPEAAEGLITRWTAESGVRSLERRLAQLCRWSALRLQSVDLASFGEVVRDEHEAEREKALATCGPDKQGRLMVDLTHLPHILGAELFEPNIAERLAVGVAMGLSVSVVGGQLLFIEATRAAGKGLTITGQLGSVMNESVRIAMSLLRGLLARSAADGSAVGVLQSARPAGADGADSGAGPESATPAVWVPFKNESIHVHFPSGGIPKDGPSAGVALLLALASLVLDRPMRSDTAVTGEISLRGHALPVGGIRDKVLAAQRAGVRYVMLPLANRRHVLDEIPTSALKDIEIIYVKHVTEALDWAFGLSSDKKPHNAAAWSAQAPDLAPGLPAAASAALGRSAAEVCLPPTSRL